MVYVEKRNDFLSLLGISPDFHEECIRRVDSADFNHVGIKVLNLEIGDDSQQTYLALLPAGQRLRNHFHKKTSEDYFIVEGDGVMHNGSKEKGGWSYRDPVVVSASDQIIVPEDTAHQLQNLREDEDLLFYFRCAPIHIVENDGGFQHTQANWYGLPDAPTLKVDM